MKGSSFSLPPLLYFMPGISGCSRTWRDESEPFLTGRAAARSTVYLCMAIHSTTPNQVIYWRRRMMKRNSLHLMPYFISFIPFPLNFLPSQLGSLHHVDFPTCFPKCMLTRTKNYSLITECSNEFQRRYQSSGELRPLTNQQFQIGFFLSQFELNKPSNSKLSTSSKHAGGDF